MSENESRPPEGGRYRQILKSFCGGFLGSIPGALCWVFGEMGSIYPLIILVLGLFIGVALTLPGVSARRVAKGTVASLVAYNVPGPFKRATFDAIMGDDALASEAQLRKLGQNQGTLTVEKLQVAYGETLILRGVDLEIGPGQLVCLMGRNGVGKTTLLKSVMGLLRPLSGRVVFDGKDITKASPDRRARAGIGYVPQGREIFPQLTVRENLQVGMLANPSRPREIPAQIYEYFPMLKQMLDRPGGLLSGGQQQQLAIARALVADPKLVILDEPTEGIQPSIITLIGEVLKDLKNQGKLSVLLVEQYIEFAMHLADRYYVMEKGAIVMQGNNAAADKEAIKPYLAF